MGVDSLRRRAQQGAEGVVVRLPRQADRRPHLRRVHHLDRLSRPCRSSSCLGLYIHHTAMPHGSHGATMARRCFSQIMKVTGCRL